MLIRKVMMVLLSFPFIRLFIIITWLNACFMVLPSGIKNIVVDVMNKIIVVFFILYMLLWFKIFFLLYVIEV